MSRFRLAMSFFVAGAISACATAPKLIDIVPTGGQRGTELEIQFIGERLHDVEEIIAYEPGLKVLSIDLATNRLVKARLKIQPDCAFGEHHLRLRAATGLSELLTFAVGDLPTVLEAEPNSDQAHAQTVALNSTVEGTITNEDVDWFAVDLKKEQQLSVEVEAMRLGRANIDLRLAVLDADGKQIAAADDTWLALQDPFVTLTAPGDAKYFITVRDVTYGGNDRAHYRLHTGTFPRPAAVFPLGGKAGEEGDFQFFSPMAGAFTNRVRLPAESKDKMPLFGECKGQRAPTPNWIRVSGFPNIFAESTGTNRDQATAVITSPPMALNGIISSAGEEHWFRVAVEKGAVLELNVYARRLRSPLDSVLDVFDSSGKSLGSNDDSVGADSSLKLTPSETNMWVRIRDRLGHGGPEFGYRIELTPPRPAVNVKIPEVARNDTQSRQFIAVPRGNRFAALISAKRANLSGNLDFSIADLPPGVAMHGEQMSANIDSMPLVFEAAADAPLGSRLLDLVAAGTNAAGRVSGTFKQEVELVQGAPNNANYYSTTVDKLCVGVIKEAPFKITIREPGVPLVQAGSMKLEVLAQRAAGFDAPIELKMVWNPPGISSDSEVTIPSGASNAIYHLNAGSGAELRDWKIAILGSATVDDGRLFASSQLAKLPIAAPFVTGKIETTWLNPGKTAKMNVSLQHGKPFEGKATIHLMGLPDKVSAAPCELSATDTEVAFEVHAESGCALGSYKNLFCAVDIVQDGHAIPHTLGSGGILRIVPEKKDAVKVAVAKGRK